MSVKDFYVMLFGGFDPYEFDMYLGEMLSAKVAETEPLERRTAAFMVHIYLTEVIGEADEPSIEPAFVLKDIYECSACIRHIAQVYIKGIMQAKGQIFGVRTFVEKDEAINIVEKVQNRGRRIRS